MKRGSRAAVGAIVAALAAVSLMAGVAGASHGDLYCLNGQSTALPAGVSYSGGSATLGAGTAHIIASLGGTFWAGFAPAFGRSVLYIPDFPGQSAPPPGVLAPGYSTNVVSLAACTVSGPPPVTHVGVCKVLARADGTTGAFQAIPVSVWNGAEGQYFDAPAANWVEGLGLTCDNPLALGYKAAGYKVSWGAIRDPNHDAKGVRGSGFNDIYPYFTK